MPFETRGGIPRVLRVTGLATTGRDWVPKFVTKWVQVSNSGANALRIFFLKADFDANANYVELAATTGFFEGPVETETLWFKAAAATTDFQAVAYQRRG